MQQIKHFAAVRCTFSGGETAVLFPSKQNASVFGTLVDEYDNPIGAVLVIFPEAASGQRLSGECQVARFGASDSVEYNSITGSRPVEVQARIAAFVIPSALVKSVGGAWKFGGKVFSEVPQFKYEY